MNGEIYVIDRFEEDTAVLEGPGGRMHDVPRSRLPAGARAGDVLRLENGVWRRDKAETARRAAEIRRMMDELFHSE